MRLRFTIALEPAHYVDLTSPTASRDLLHRNIHPCWAFAARGVYLYLDRLQSWLAGERATREDAAAVRIAAQ